MARNSSASAKVILTGEYSMVFGHPGVAAPSPLKMNIMHEESDGNLEILWKGAKGDHHWDTYLQDILKLIEKEGVTLTGSLTIDNELPLGKGMGSSTALVIGLARCLLSERKNVRDTALSIEDAVNPGHSGMDFNVIWEESPIRFSKTEGATPVSLPDDTFQHCFFIDTGKPHQQTPELVAWVKERVDDLKEPIETIAECTERFLSGESLRSLLPTHHQAQVALGTVPKHVQNFIAALEKEGGTAKVLGAGSRTGGGGMVFGYCEDTDILKSLTTEHISPIAL